MYWIPASERSPNDKECNRFDKSHPSHRKFLCTIKIEGFEPIVITLYYSERYGWSYQAEDYNEDVVAWMPLPEPFEKQNKTR